MEITVRKQLVEALEAWKAASAAEDRWYETHRQSVRHEMFRLYAEAERLTPLALERARAEPELSSSPV